jgi:hypothetical protein
MVPIQANTLKASCKAAVTEYKKIFTDTRVFQAFFGDVPRGYHYSIGMLALLSFTDFPIELLQNATTVSILNYPAFINSEEKSISLKFTSILQVLKDREMFCTLLQAYDPSSMNHFSLPMAKILAITKLHSLGTHALAKNVEEYFLVLNDARFLPFLFPLLEINSCDICLETYFQVFSTLPTEAYPPELHSSFILSSPLIRLYHLQPAEFSKLTTVYGPTSVPQFVNHFKDGWEGDFSEDADTFLRKFHPTSPIVILPYRPLSIKYGCISTGNALDFHNDTSSIHFSIANNQLIIDKSRCPVYYILRITEKAEYIATSMPHKEPAVPGSLYAVTTSSFNQYDLDKTIQKLARQVELLVDALIENGFSIFSLYPSLNTE